MSLTPIKGLLRKLDHAGSRPPLFRLEAQELDEVREPIVPQGGRWASHVLGLDLSLEGGSVRFFHGNAPLLDAQELILQLSTMVDEALQRAEDAARRADRLAARRAEGEPRRAEGEARRAEDEARRADRLAARLRQLGVDPDEESR